MIINELKFEILSLIFLLLLLLLLNSKIPAIAKVKRGAKCAGSEKTDEILGIITSINIGLCLPKRNLKKPVPNKLGL
jgi:hypothetical protein